MVVVVNADEVAELQMAGKTRGFTSNTLHGTAIAKEAVGVIREEVKSGLIEDGSRVRLRNSQTDGVRETLTKRTGCDFNTFSIMSLGVARRDAVNLLRATLVLSVHLKS